LSPAGWAFAAAWVGIGFLFAPRERGTDESDKR